MRAKLPIINAFIAAVIASLFSWYYQNIKAQNYARGLISSPSELVSQSYNRTNIALLGIGGAGHEGGELTDSIMIASLNHKTHLVTLLSIPRDIWLTSSKSKINSIYYYAEKRSPGSGLVSIQESLNSVTGIPIHYSVLIDFSGFIKAIDAIGGITINVENSFDDYKYPIPGKENAEPESARYEHLHFDAGIQKMDGVTALKFVRSRHAIGDEGTDFARSARQQKVIYGFITSFLSPDSIFNVERVSALKNSISQSVQTNIPDAHVTALIKLGLSIDFEKISTFSIESQLYNPKNLAPYAGAWVLMPKNSWEDIHSYVQANLK
ncbi:MAG: LytR family transcriptional regulator [Thiothrix sp.]|nr:MAG: LytR family transcriptional regulator [Thiothrix sp.]